MGPGLEVIENYLLEYLDIRAGLRKDTLIPKCAYRVIKTSDFNGRSPDIWDDLGKRYKDSNEFCTWWSSRVSGEAGMPEEFCLHCNGGENEHVRCTVKRIGYGGNAAFLTQRYEGVLGKISSSILWKFDDRLVAELLARPDFESMTEAIEDVLGIRGQFYKPKCGDVMCQISTGVHEGYTFGSGGLDFNGYWEKPCGICARDFEEKNPKAGPCWPFKEGSEGSEETPGDNSQV
jgi:hypothetical protein